MRTSTLGSISSERAVDAAYGKLAAATLDKALREAADPVQWLTTAWVLPALGRPEAEAPKRPTLH